VEIHSKEIKVKVVGQKGSCSSSTKENHTRIIPREGECELPIRGNRNKWVTVQEPLVFGEKKTWSGEI